MKSIFALLIILMTGLFALAQNEQSPMVEKEIIYKDWTYKNPKTGGDVNLRSLTKGKKLTIVVYYAPWCPNWRHDAPMLERFYQKYNDKGLEIVGVEPVAPQRIDRIGDRRQERIVWYKPHTRRHEDKRLALAVRFVIEIDSGG